jgi:quercetin dioxygenase-like cupin family protein
MADAAKPYQHTSWAAIEARTPADGIERRMFVGDRLMACRLHFEPHVVTPIHRHPHEQMSLVESGRVRFYIEDGELIAGPGDVLHFPSNVLHGATMLDEEVVIVDIFTPIREDFLR